MALLGDTPYINRGGQVDYKKLFYSNPNIALTKPIHIPAGYGPLPMGQVMGKISESTNRLGQYVPYVTEGVDVGVGKTWPGLAYLVADGAADAYAYVTMDDSYKFSVGDHCVAKVRASLDYYDQFGKRHQTRLPKGTTKKQAQDQYDEIKRAIKKETFIPDKEIQALLDAEPDPEFHCLYRTGLASGARQGELVALTWDDIDFEKRAIKINKTYSSGVLNKPKTQKSNRIIEKIASGAIDELAEWKEICPKNDLNLVFPNKAGKYLHKADIGRRHFKPALKRAGLSEKITFHWLRHTYGSYLMLEESIQFVSKQMGHSSIAVTQKIHIHLIKDSTSEDLSERMEERMFGKLKKKTKLHLVKK